MKSRCSRARAKLAETLGVLRRRRDGRRPIAADVAHWCSECGTNCGPATVRQPGPAATATDRACPGAGRRVGAGLRPAVLASASRFSAGRAAPSRRRAAGRERPRTSPSADAPPVVDCPDPQLRAPTRGFVGTLVRPRSLPSRLGRAARHAACSALAGRCCDTCSRPPRLSPAGPTRPTTAVTVLPCAGRHADIPWSRGRNAAHRRCWEQPRPTLVFVRVPH